MEFTLHLHDLAVGYDQHVVLDHIALHANAGDLVVLMGTNGSGKSTLLRTLAGLLEPVAGECMVLDDVAGGQAERIAYLPQHPAALGTLPLRASDVVAMGRYARRGLISRFNNHDRDVVEHSMKRMGVLAFRDKPLHALSGGQQQRVHLAQILAREADVLLLDEPTAGLDAQGRDAVARMVDHERARGCTVVMATHDLVDAEPANTVLLLAHRLVAQGSPSEVLTDENLRATYGFTDRH
jgi:ABC-type Mn2+/Zn2+ transport system ATPase subunit